jgi:hypothetical protein
MAVDRSFSYADESLNNSCRVVHNIGHEFVLFSYGCAGGIERYSVIGHDTGM